MTVLDEILVRKRDEVTMLRRPTVRDLLRQRALDAPAPRDFAAAIRPADGTLGLIAEIKRRSPSKGDLAPDLDPAYTAKAYAAGGASALSVLTDQLFFGGSVADLEAARTACDLPVLRKDFTIDEVQIYEARAIGADAVLLICAALPDDAHLTDLYELATTLGLAVLVETHDEAEIARAVSIGASIIGVNARNLATFNEDLGRSERLRSLIPTDAIAVAESAIRSRDDAARMAAAGFDAVLVGEALVRHEQPTDLARSITELAVSR